MALAVAHTAPMPAAHGEIAALPAAARTILGRNQGVYVESASGAILLAQAADEPVHPASVSKVPTTLALLRKLGPDFRFTTRFVATGPVQDGVLRGDLLIENDGNPSLVDEDALAIARELNGLGIVRVSGALRLQGPMIFNWEPDDGRRMQRALSGFTSASAWETVSSWSLSRAQPAAQSAADIRPAVGFGEAQASAISPSNAPASIADIARAVPLLVHRSQPLLPLIKSLNDYSNNVFAPLAAVAGGPAAVQELSRTLLPPQMREEIVLGDGAGADPANRMSPRVAVRLLRELEKQLAASGHALFDILPVAGVDAGTLEQRFRGAGETGCVVGKTGTFGSYGASALIGAIRAGDGTTIYFAILNHGVPVSSARHRQDRFVRLLLARFKARPWPYERDPRPAITRALLQSPVQSGR